VQLGEENLFWIYPIVQLSPNFILVKFSTVLRLDIHLSQLNDLMMLVFQLHLQTEGALSMMLGVLALLRFPEIERVYISWSEKLER